jgi:large subunit ribosomal protein L17
MRNLSHALLDRERITTTLEKAKELRRFTEKLVTLSKRETLHARRRVLRHIPDRRIVAKLFDTISARYTQRPGGYTRIIKLGPRKGDAAEMALIELVAAQAKPDTAETEAPAKGKKAAARGSRAKGTPATGAAAGTGEQEAAKAPAKRKKAPRKAGAGAEKGPKPKKSPQKAVRSARKSSKGS